MASPGLINRAAPSPKKRAAPKKKAFNPGGQKGKLHRELGIPTSQKIPAARLAAATRSSKPAVRRDAIRAKTMEGWNKR